MGKIYSNLHKYVFCIHLFQKIAINNYSKGQRLKTNKQENETMVTMLQSKKLTFNAYYIILTIVYIGKLLWVQLFESSWPVLKCVDYLTSMCKLISDNLQNVNIQFHMSSNAVKLWRWATGWTSDSCFFRYPSNDNMLLVLYPIFNNTWVISSTVHTNRISSSFLVPNPKRLLLKNAFSRQKCIEKSTPWGLSTKIN